MAWTLYLHLLREETLVSIHRGSSRVSAWRNTRQYVSEVEARPLLSEYMMMETGRISPPHTATLPWQYSRLSLSCMNSAITENQKCHFLVPALISWGTSHHPRTFSKPQDSYLQKSKSWATPSLKSLKVILSLEGRNTNWSCSPQL